jgi:transposase
MESISFATGTNSEKLVILAFDVSQDRLDLYTIIRGRSMKRAFPNRILSIEWQLNLLSTAARQAGAEQVLVVAEASGGYQDPLFRAALRLGLKTALVSGEAVSKMRVVESNDTGKTDIKDPRVIHLLATLGKTLQHRILDESYELLREWNRIYEAADCGVVEAKCSIHKQIKTLFPDFDFTKDFLYGASGQALVKGFGANPYKIVAVTSERFARGMKRLAPRIRTRSIERLCEQARSSARTALRPRQVEVIETRLIQLWEDYERYLQRKEQARQVMEELYQAVRKEDPRLPAAQKGVITAFHLSRLVAETGPISDFSSWRKLMRFAGLNLCERRSGTYRGRTKISKKGRRLLRKILSQVTLPLVRRDRLYGPYYHRKREQEKMPGPKAMTAVSRKILKMIYGWYQSGEAFDRSRVFTCKSQLARVA